MTTIENKEIEESWVKQDWVYIKTALILAFFTAIEVFTYFESVHKAPEWLLVTTLSFLMVVKFFLVAGVFMHLKDDNSVFTKMMTMGMCIAWPVYFIMAFAFGFLPDWNVIIKVLFLFLPPGVAGFWLGFSFKGGDGGHH